MSGQSTTSDPEPEVVSAPRRVITYIDGFNLYFGMKEAGKERLLWLDLVALGIRLLKPYQSLVGTRYFTSRISQPPESVKRQTTYIEALLTLPRLRVIEGQYRPDIVQCVCGRLIHKPVEKMTDVNIAVELTKDAHADRFDTALLITGDSDQVPVLQMLKELFPSKRIVVAFPPKRVSEVLRRHGPFINIGHSDLANSQLPDEVAKPDGVTLHRPKEWA